MKPSAPSLQALAGTPVMLYPDDRPPRPFRPYQTAAATTPRIFMDAFRFQWRGYSGHLDIGMDYPAHKLRPKSKQVIWYVPWRPWLSWGVLKDIPGQRHDEGHHERSVTHGPATDRLLGIFTALMAPELGLTNRQHVYRLSPEFLGAFEEYLEEYFARPEILARVSLFWAED